MYFTVAYTVKKPALCLAAEDALSLRDGYSSSSIINYRQELEAHRSHSILGSYFQEI